MGAKSSVGLTDLGRIDTGPEDWSRAAGKSTKACAESAGRRGEVARGGRQRGQCAAHCGKQDDFAEDFGGV